jgi:hypothetical protein
MSRHVPFSAVGRWLLAHELGPFTRSLKFSIFDNKPNQDIDDPQPLSAGYLMQRKTKLRNRFERNQVIPFFIMGLGAVSLSVVTNAIGQYLPAGSADGLTTNDIPAVLTVTNQPEPLLETQVQPPPPPIAGTSQLAPAASLIPIAGSGMGPLHLGRIDFHPHLAYQLSYGNGLQSSPGQKTDTLINTISPGILIRVGTHWTLDYTPSLRFYSDSRMKDETDHAVSLVGTTTYQDWTFGLSQGYASTSEPLIETGSQTDQESYNTGLTANYRFGSQMSLDLGLNQSFRFVDQAVAAESLTDVREWSTTDWLNYQFAPSLSAGIGAGFTYDNTAYGPDMTSEQLQGRVIWRVRNKLNFLLTGGLNDQQFLSSGSSDLLTPIFSLAAEYRLFDTTTLSLSGSRAVTPSYFQNASTESTTINAGLNQRILGKLYLNIGGAYGTTAYHGTTSGPIGGGVGDYNTTSFNVGLSTTLLKRATASVFYQVSYNSSSSALYNYTIRQAGLALAYQF